MDMNNLGLKKPTSSAFKQTMTLLAAYVLRERTSLSDEETKGYIRNCLRSIYNEHDVDALLQTSRFSKTAGAIVLKKSEWIIQSTNLTQPGDVSKMMDGFIRASGNEQFLDFHGPYEIKYFQIQTGKPAEPTCIALVFGPHPEQFDPHLIDAASIEMSRDNPEGAARLLRRAADQGMARAQYNLGILLYDGSIPKDLVQAVKLFESAAAQDYPDAVYMLAFMRENGYGCIKDLQYAFELYKKGASLNEPDSQCKVALLLLDADLQRKAGVSYRNEGWNFVRANHDESRRLLREAGSQGHTLARRILNSLGV
jgi:hypothetical protein